MDGGQPFDSVVARHDELYGDQYDSWYETGHWTEESFPESAADTVDRYPKRTIAGPNDEVTFKELYDRAQKLAGGLQNRGIEPGDVVSYQLPNWVTSNVVHLAVSMAGAIANPIIPIYRHDEVSYILSDAESKCIFIPERYRDFDYPSMIEELREDLPNLEEVVVVSEESNQSATFRELLDTGQDLRPPTYSPEDPHVLVYTSGTTSDPKGVVHSHNTLWAAERARVQIYKQDADSKPFVPSPVTHIAGLVNVLELPLRVGMPVVMMDRWDPDAAIDRIEAEQCDISGGATTFVHDMIKAAPEKWESPLRRVGVGGAYISPEIVMEATDRLDCLVSRGYGSSELPGACKAPEDAALEKCATRDGRPFPDVAMKIVDLDTREELSPGEEGEILAYGPNLMLGYNDTDLNTENFEGKWFKTGDVGSFDEDGWIEITGRTKDVIIRGGENIAVKDVEDRLQEHSAVDNVAIVAMPDPKYQEKPCAYLKVVESSQFDFETMTEYLESQQIAKQKFPERLELVDSFPRTASGKIKKTQLREDVAEKLGREPVQR